MPLPGETMLDHGGCVRRDGITCRSWESSLAAIIGAVVGDNIGFGIGWFGGYPLLRRFGKYVRLDEAKLKVGRYIFMRHGAKVVFFGRFVSVLAHLRRVSGRDQPDALVALPDRQRRRRRSSGQRCTALAPTAASSVIAKLSTPVEIGFAALAVVVIMLAGIIFVRNNIKRLEAVAEAALPGPLEGFAGKPTHEPTES